MRTTTLVLLLLICIFNSYAQDKKKIVIKKTELIEKSSSENESPSEMTIDDINHIETDFKKDGSYLTLTKENINGKESTLYTLTTISDGEKKVIKWDGNGEMPAEIKEKMGEININENMDGDVTTITIDAKDGKAKVKKEIEKITIIDGERSDDDVIVINNNDEDGVKKEVRIITKDDGSKEKQVTVIKGGEKENKSHKVTNFGDKDSDDSSNNKSNTSKVMLGVMVNESENGLKVVETVDDGVATLAGVRIGDIILKINDDYIFSYKLLKNKMMSFDKGDKAKLTVLRSGKEKVFKLQF